MLPPQSACPKLEFKTAFWSWWWISGRKAAAPVAVEQSSSCLLKGQIKSFPDSPIWNSARQLICSSFLYYIRGFLVFLLVWVFFLTVMQCFERSKLVTADRGVLWHVQKCGWIIWAVFAMRYMCTRVLAGIAGHALKVHLHMENVCGSLKDRFLLQGGI